MTQEHVVHPFRGGMFSNALADIIPDGWFAYVQNAEYTMVPAPDGARISVKKRLGTARYNATAYDTSADFTALSDFWRHGVTLAPTQKLVGCAGTAIVKDDLDGAWDEIKTTWGATTTDQNICIAQGYAVFSTSNNDIPQIWNQTGNTADLNVGGTPRFTACVYHLRRLWTVGETTSLSGAVNPSRSTYSAAGDITDFSGGDTGSFIFDDDDGDRLIGVSQPFQERLYYFKGPNTGSLHVVYGLTPTTFVKNKLFTGLPVVAHKGIITTASDIYWMSQYGIHSLSATLSAGKEEVHYLSYPIQDIFRGLNFTRLNQVASFSHPNRNLIGWAVPSGSGTTNDTILVYNTATRMWAVWVFNGFTPGAFMVARTPTTSYPRLYVGGYDGFVRAGDQTILTDDGTTAGYTFLVRSPSHARMPGKSETQEASYQRLYTFLRPTGAFRLGVNASVDGLSQTATMDMSTGAGDLIGTTLVIGTGKIGGASNSSIAPVPLEGRGRQIQLEYTQSGGNEDAELYGYTIQYEPGEPFSAETT